MLDINLIRENPEFVKKSCKNRGYDLDIDELIRYDGEWRESKQKSDELKHKRNAVSEEINQLKKEGRDIKAKIREIKEIPEKIKRLDEETERLREKINAVMHNIPNIMDKSVPVGDASKNKIIKENGKKKKFNFPVKHHWELGESLDIIDLKRASKLSGEGFYVLKGKGAIMQRALIQFMLDFHVKNGFTEINPPQIVKGDALFGTGNLPKFADQLYKTEDSYLIPTAEVPLTNLHANENLDENELPKKYSAFTECYRTEAGRHGTETRGIFRLHQFEKVEMVYITKPEDSMKALEEMKGKAEKICEMLGLPYRTILLSTQDSGFASSKTYDIEVYSPALKKYLETSSCSNCTDFQARRANIKFKTTQGNRYAHTLNGSGLALPRLMISILENYQQKDGSINIPKALWKYTGFKKIESAQKETKFKEEKSKKKK
jgi:seryl-tRNA synthetase